MKKDREIRKGDKVWWVDDDYTITAVVTETDWEPFGYEKARVLTDCGKVTLVKDKSELTRGKPPHFAF